VGSLREGGVKDVSDIRGGRDLTRGPLAKQIVRFSLPLIFTNLLQVLFNMADVAVVGRFAGPMALGSVGSTTILASMFTWFIIGMGSGINVLTATCFGAKDRKGLRETVHSAALLSLMIGAALLVIGVSGTRFLLELLNTKPELLAGAVTYLRICFLGMPALMLYNFGNAVFTAVGETRKPMLYLTIAGVLNVALNLFFVIGCGLAEAGVAIATVTSQYVSALLTVGALFRSRTDYGLCFAELRLTGVRVRKLLSFGIPAGLQSSAYSIANLFVQVGVNSFDAVLVAGNSAATNADNLVYDVMAAFYTACGSFIGQNCGAGDRERVRRSYLISLGYSFGIGLVMGVALRIFGLPFLFLFTKDPLVAEMGLKRLNIMSLSYCVSALMDCTVAANRGLGKNALPTVFMFLGSCVFRIIWIFTVFAHFGTIPSLYLLYVCSWTLTGVLELGYFIHVYRKWAKSIA